MTLHLRLISLLILLSPLSLLAQGVRHVNIAQGSVTLAGSSGFSGAVSRILSGASVTVCNGSTLPPTGSICTSLATIYSDIALTQTLSNPISADTNGNYSFYANGGVPYVISVSFTGFTTYSYVWSAPFSTIINTQITTNNVLPGVAGTYSLGSGGFPYLSLALGSATNQATTQNSAATGSRSITWLDSGGSPSLSIATAAVNLSAQQANISATTFYTVPANAVGFYRVTCYLVETQAATVSSTLGPCTITWTDNDTNVSNTQSSGSTFTGNTVGLVSNFTTNMVNCKAGSVIQYTTTSYASSGATPMQYALHIRLEYIGP